MIFANTIRGWARVEGPTLMLLTGDPLYGEVRETGERLELEKTPLLAPVSPRKIIAIARNYRAHAAELGNAVPEEPLFFYKPTTSLTPPDGSVPLPRHVGRVEHEGELAVVIKTKAKAVREEDAKGHIFGYTCANDVTARELQKKLGHFSQAKGYDGFCPVGPWIATDIDTSDLRVTLSKNGVIAQDGRTSQMVHSIERLVSYLSHQVTLEPGDLILTGTPQGVGPLVHGDRVEVSIENVGTLRHSVTE